VFVYPTWWMSMPAVMKAWLERVMVPGVAFGRAHRRREVVAVQLVDPNVVTARAKAIGCSDAEGRAVGRISRMRVYDNDVHATTVNRSARTGHYKAEASNNAKRRE
jgi:Flavodoxin-like fold